MVRQTICTILVSGAAAGLALGCAPLSSVTIGGGGRHPTRVEHPGPPPHAPAHGRRHKNRGHHERDVDLVFDSGLGVYVVVGLPNHFYWNGTYLRLDGDRWYASIDLNGGWKPHGADAVPPGLRHKHHAKKRGKGRGKSKGKGRGHGRHPAKGRW